MSGTALCVAAILLGVNYDVRTLPTGGVEYIILVDSLDLKSLAAASDLHSDVPPSIRGDVRSFSIRLVNGQQPGVGPSPAFTAPPIDSRPAAPSPLFSLNTPELAPPGGGKFPTTPSAMPPMPTLDNRPNQDKQPGRRTNYEQTPAGPGPITPSTSAPYKPLTETPSPSVTIKLPGDPKGPKEPAATGTDKPQPPKATSHAELDTLRPEPTKESQGLLWQLATAGSSIGMVYFGWVAADYRRRYYALLSRGGQSPRTSKWEHAEDEAESDDPPIADED